MAFRLKGILRKRCCENSNDFTNVVHAYPRRSRNGSLEIIGKKEGGKKRSASSRYKAHEKLWHILTLCMACLRHLQALLHRSIRSRPFQANKSRKRRKLAEHRRQLRSTNTHVIVPGRNRIGDKVANARHRCWRELPLHSAMSRKARCRRSNLHAVGNQGQKTL